MIKTKPLMTPFISTRLSLKYRGNH